MRKRDWMHTRRLISRIKKKAPGWKAWGHTLCGIAVGLVFVLVVWIPSHSEFDKQTKEDWDWVGPVILVVIAAFVVAMILCFVAARDSGTDTETSVNDVLEYMDEVEVWFSENPQG